MDRLFTYFEYWKDNPPIGMLFKQFIEAKYGKGKQKFNSGNTAAANTSDGGIPRPKKPKSFKNDEDKLAWEKADWKWQEYQLGALKSMFGMSGGIVRECKGVNK
jgi:hypothetical protein